MRTTDGKFSKDEKGNLLAVPDSYKEVQFGTGVKIAAGALVTTAVIGGLAEAFTTTTVGVNNIRSGDLF